MPYELSALIGGAFALSVLHALIPNHWLPFVILGRNEKWRASTTLLATFLGGSAHLASTVIIGVILGLVGLASFKAFEHLYTFVAASILVILGILLIVRHIRGKDGHFHTHFSEVGEHSHGKSSGRRNADSTHIHANGKRAIVSISALVVMMFFSPCLELEAYYLVAARLGWVGIALVSVVYFVITVGLMVVFVGLAYRGLESLKWKTLERNEGFIGGTLLILLGILWMLFPL